MQIDCDLTQTGLITKLQCKSANGSESTGLLAAVAQGRTTWNCDKLYIVQHQHVHIVKNR